MNKKNVLVLGPLSSGHIQAWLSPLRKLCKFYFLTTHNTSSEFSLGDIKFVSLLGNKVLSFIALIYFAFFQYHFKKYDTLYVSFASSYGLLSLFLMKRRKIKRILSVWGTDINGPIIKRSKLHIYFIKLSLRRYDVINSPALHITKKLNKVYGVPLDKIETFQYGVEPPSIEELNGSLHKDNDFLDIVSIRNWSFLYQIPQLIHGVVYFAKNIPNQRVRLHIFGSGNFEESELINTMASDISLDNLEVIVHGKVERTQFLKQVLGYDLFISMPDRDGLPLSVLECASRGLYPVLSRIDANIELFHEPFASFINDVNTPSSISDALNYALNIINCSSNDSILSANKNMILANHDYSRNVQRMFNLF